MTQKRVTNAELRSLGIIAVIIAVALIVSGSDSGTFQTHIIIYVISAIFGILGLGSISMPKIFGPTLAALINRIEGSDSNSSSKSGSSRSTIYVYQDNRGAKGQINKIGSNGNDKINIKNYK